MHKTVPSVWFTHHSDLLPIALYDLTTRWWKRIQNYTSSVTITNYTTIERNSHLKIGWELRYEHPSTSRWKKEHSPAISNNKAIARTCSIIRIRCYVVPREEFLSSPAGVGCPTGHRHTHCEHRQHHQALHCHCHSKIIKKIRIQRDTREREIGAER